MDVHDVKAIEYKDGTKRWFTNGKLDREDGPAIEDADGNKYWCRDDEYHRDDGPAIELSNGEKVWYLFGIKLTASEFKLIKRIHP